MSNMEMFCVVCDCNNRVHTRIQDSDFGGYEVWECTHCGLREPKKKGDVQLQREEPKAPAPILTKEVPSSKGDTTYTLTKDSSGWRCDCPGFKYRSQCKHAKAADAEKKQGEPMLKAIHYRCDLIELAKELSVRPDWHEPDEQGVTARVRGNVFDNAGFWPERCAREDKNGMTQSMEMYVLILKDLKPVAAVNLATLLSWACSTGKEDE